MVEERSGLLAFQGLSTNNWLQCEPERHESLEPTAAAEGSYENALQEPNPVTMEDAELQVLVAKVAMSELRENKSNREQSIQELREWVEKHPDIRNCRTDDAFLLAFLRVKKFSVPAAQETLIRFLSFLHKMADLTRGCDILDPTVANILDTRFMVTSPYRDEKGRQVTIIAIRNIDVHRMRYQDTARAQFVHLFTLLEDDASQVLGHVYILDISDVTPGHATYWPTSTIIACIEAVQKSFPLRHKEIHAVNVHPVMQVLLQLVLSLSTQKIRDRFHAHKTLEDLHKKVSPKALPKEYGGTMPMEQMYDLWKKTLLAKRDLVASLENMQLLQNTGTQLEVGSFRKLEVD